jgi:hypothetical protein
MNRTLAVPATRSQGVQDCVLQRRCACGNHSMAGRECAECGKSRARLQRSVAIGATDDRCEREAERIAGQVMSQAPPSDTAAGPVRVQRFGGEAAGASGLAPASVDSVLAGSGRELEPTVRRDMEQRFGHDFSRVRIHSGAAAERSALEVAARAYTVGHDIVFGAGGYAPQTREGRHLLAHELTHVLQQTGAGNGARPPGVVPAGAGTALLQRAPAKQSEAYYQNLVKQKKWCRDSEKSGQLHPGQQCYREIPAKRGYPSGNQVCFDKTTGKFVEESPDFVSAVSGQNADGTCDIPMGLLDPPQPFTRRGRRALGHLIGDIATEDSDLIGKHYGRIAGLAMGIALPKESLDSDFAPLLVPVLLGFLAGKLGERGLPVLDRLARRHGFLPTISAGVGNQAGLSLGLGVGFEKRDRALPLIPVNSYLTFGLDSTLAIGGEAGSASTIQAKVGIRIDPGKQGGLFALTSLGAGVAAGKELSGVRSVGVGAGVRATDFLDVQVVRETVSGGGDAGTTYWLTLNLVAPQRVLKGH